MTIGIISNFKTVSALKPRLKKVICVFGVGSHFEYWGFSTDSIIELDWYEQAGLMSNWSITATPACHFSGITKKRKVQ